MTTHPTPIRCAIYTRVSTDSGLDQEFNSLDAQYDASSAYVRSQAHAHWFGLKDASDAVGKTDFDLPWPRHQAELFRAADREVIQSGEAQLDMLEQLRKLEAQYLPVAVDIVKKATSQQNEAARASLCGG